ncbi:hypothetical protein [Ponticoccus sp. (in: a-proteobacteria)]|uniref:hypothetical protein n=1 Tax=Ponticoccus sp. (in: a-proteobacteria) TaxID=1925025 RepID=UPI003AB38902
MMLPSYLHSSLLPLVLLFAGLTIAGFRSVRRAAARRRASTARFHAVLDEIEDQMRAQATLTVERGKRFNAATPQLGETEADRSRLLVRVR